MSKLTPFEHNELIKAQIANSFKPLENDLEKGRGPGGIAGKTSSGKDVFNRSNDAPKGHHESFTSQDHKDAMKIHADAGNFKAAKAHQARAKTIDHHNSFKVGDRFVHKQTGEKGVITHKIDEHEQSGYKTDSGSTSSCSTGWLKHSK